MQRSFSRTFGTMSLRLALFTLMFCAFHPVQAQKQQKPYTYIGLTLGGNVCRAQGVNNGGAVVGYGFLAGGSFSGQDDRAFYWKNLDGDNVADANEYVMLPAYGGFSKAIAINNAGEIVGTAAVTPGNAHAVYWDAITHAITDLNTYLPLGSNWVLVAANDIKDNRQVVGNAKVTIGSGTEIHQFLLDLNTGSITDLGLGTAWGLNNLSAPQIVGSANSVGTLYDGTLWPLSPLYNTRGINDDGGMVGNAWFSYSTWTRPIYWQDQNGDRVVDAGELTDIGTFETIDGGGLAYSINNAGMVVGSTERKNKGVLRQIAFRWQAGTSPSTKQDLNDLTNADITLQTPYSISDTGYIAGSGFKDTNSLRITRGFVLRPNF